MSPNAPIGIARFGLSRGEAAYFAGVSVGSFDKMVSEGMLPKPRIWGARKIWLRPDLEQAMMEWPEAAPPNPWDEIR